MLDSLTRKQIASELLEQYGDPIEAAKAVQNFLPSTWCESNDFKNEAGLPLDYSTTHRFMREPLNDLSPLQVWLKPPQIGATVAQILKSFWVANYIKKDIVYTLPTSSDVVDMAGGKINRLIAQNPVLGELIKEHDTVEQKSVGDNIIYYRGTFTTRQAMMVSSDLNIHDEVDASDSAVITQYETRLQAKADGWRWYFSHPSQVGRGVDVYWNQSDKKEWFITCNTCKHEQILEWPDSIDRTTGRFHCKSCKATISNEERVAGDWRATSTGIFSGYHISQLMCPWITAEQIIQTKEDPLKDEQYFFNYVLGLPYISKTDSITVEQVLANCSPKPNPMTARVVIGVDTGLPIHYVCGNKDGVFFHDTCNDYRPLRDLLKLWDNAVIVSDQGGDLIGIRLLQEEFPGRVFLAYYRKDRKSVDLVQWGQSSEFGKVVIDRNRMISLMLDQMKDTGRIMLNGTKEEWTPFAKHFANMYRELVLSPDKPQKDSSALYGAEYVWKRSGPDHFAHATNYMLAGMTKFSETMSFMPHEPFAGIPREGDPME